MKSFVKNKEYLFVYGTLRKDPKNQKYRILARHADFVGEGAFRGKLYDIGEYPGTIPSNRASDVVKGEVYALRNPNYALGRLDEYEGCGPDESYPTEFRREKKNIFLDNGEKVNAWVYIYNRPIKGLKAIPSGDYLKFRELKQ